ncbi:PTS transporter subunit EIIC [Amphibacillus sp. Q70]|uniref:PTS transporter subunit EIIC n=1 Tax=Amphibacillus sp. Q70 TaxID=3453416 RepID=UPI003F84CE88
MANKELAIEILKGVGSQNNVSTLMHCATRLRFTLKDESLYNDKAIQAIDGVMGTKKAGNQYQIIIGPGVAKVYGELTDLIDYSVETNEDTKDERQNNGYFKNILDTISGLFTPILPAITGGAMIKVLLILLEMTGLLSEGSQTYQILTFVGDTPFYFLPIMIAYTASVKFKLNPIIGMFLGLMLIHPAYMDMVSLGESVNFIGLPVTLANYTSTVIPVILIIWVASYVEMFADKVSPNAIKFFFKPLLTILFMVPIAFIIIGPLGTIVGTWLGAGLNIIQTEAQWLLPIIFGILSPIVIMFGMHYVVTIPLVIAALEVNGFDMIGPGFLVANMAQGGAALAIGLLTTKTQLKALANSSSLTAILGVSEPAIYGVNLRYRKPFFAAMIGGGIGGIIAGVIGVKRIVFGPTGLSTIAIFIDPGNSLNIIFAIVAVIVSFGLSFLLAYLLVKNDSQIMNEIK